MTWMNHQTTDYTGNKANATKSHTVRLNYLSRNDEVLEVELRLTGLEVAADMSDQLEHGKLQWCEQNLQAHWDSASVRWPSSMTCGGAWLQVNTGNMGSRRCASSRPVWETPCQHTGEWPTRWRHLIVIQCGSLESSPGRTVQLSYNPAGLGETYISTNLMML